MGSGISRASSALCARRDAFQQKHENIFDIAPDEKAFSIEFISELFNKKPEDIVKELILPEENTILDIMSDPLIFTLVSSPTQAWREIVAPLFTGNDSTKPYQQQLLTALFTYLKQRPICILEEDDKYQLKLRHKRKEDNNKATALHNKYPVEPPIPMEPYIKALNNIQNFLDLINHEKNKGLVYHKLYKKVTDEFGPFESNPNYSYALVRWGFLSADFTAVLLGYNQLLQHIKNDKKFTVKTTFPDFHEVDSNITIKSAISLPTTSGMIGDIGIPNLKVNTDHPQSIICADGRNVFILGKHSMLQIISLADKYVSVENRFKQYDLRINKKERPGMFITTSNGYLIIGGQYLHAEKIYKLHPFSEIETKLSYSSSSIFKSTPRICAPLVSDGQKVYSLVGGKRIAVFSVNPPNIIFHRYIDFKESGKQMLIPYQNKLFSKKWATDAVISTNGVVINFMVLTRTDNGRFDYFIRTFSLADGSHVCDSTSALRFPILSITADPWNTCMWAVAASKENVSLLKFQSNGSKPSWLTGNPVSKCPTSYEVLSSFEKAEKPVSALQAIGNFISFYGPQFAGASTLGILTSNCYSATTVHFFAPCTARVVRALVNLIDTLTKMTPKKGFYDENFLNSSLLGSINFLQYNLSNIQARDLSNALSDEQIQSVITILVRIFDDPTFDFAHTAVAYVFVSSFSLLFKNQNARCASVFQSIFETMSPDFIYTMLRYVQNDHFFAYCFTSASCKAIISPLLDKLIDAPHELKQCQSELLHLFQRNIMVEMRKMYAEYPGELPLMQEQLQSTFFAYSRLMMEKAIILVQSISSNYREELLKYSVFIRLFRKWLMMLQPLAKYTRVSQQLVALLKPLFQQLGSIVNQKAQAAMRSDKKGFTFTYELFWEVFSLFIEFISALLNGGSEMHTATQYIWLVRSTIESGVNAENFPLIYKEFNDDEIPIKKKYHLIERGLSKLSNDQLSFMIEAFNSKEPPSYKKLMDFLYTKINDQMNKKISDEQRRTERIVFVALAKQLGFANDIFLLSKQVESGTKPVLSQFIRQVVQTVYKVRHQIHSVYQHTNNYALSAEKLRRPPKLEENYDLYLDSVLKKCVFLLYIPPCSPDAIEDKNGFDDHKRRLYNFIVGQMLPEQCFVLIESADIIHKNISIGIGLINEVIRGKSNDTCVGFMLDRIASSKPIMKYLSSLKVTGKSKGDIGYTNVLKLLDLLAGLIGSSQDSIVNSLIVFYTNLLMTIGQNDIPTILEPTISIFDKLLEQKKMPKNHMHSYIALVSACIYGVVIESLNVDGCNQLVSSISKHIFQDDKIDELRLSIARLCLSTGCKLPFREKSILKFVKSAPPRMHHSAFSFLYDYIALESNHEQIIAWLLQEISSIAAGSRRHNKESAPPMTHITANSSSAQTPGIFLSSCAEMIRLFRRILSKNNPLSDYVKKVFVFILEYNMSRDSAVPQEFKAFRSRFLLFGVFSVLSNAIDIPKPYSLMKNSSNNDIFYITSVDSKEGKYLGWKIPINANSKIQTVDFTSSLQPVSVLPFQPGLFREYDCLLPYFKQVLQNKTTGFHTNALTFLILSSLSDYVTDQEFLGKLLQSDVQFTLSRFSIHNSTDDFMTILRRHLAKDSDGFLATQSRTPRLTYCSQCGYVDNTAFNLTETRITANKGAQSFVSDVLGLDCATYFQLNALNKASFEVGIHCFSLHESTSETILISSERGIVTTNGYQVAHIHSMTSFHKIALEYDPQKKRLRFYDSNGKLYSAVVDHPAVAFVLHTFGRAEFTYLLGHSPPDNIPMNALTAKYLCPSAGRAVFVKKKFTGKRTLEEALKDCSIVQKGDAKVETTIPEIRKLSENRDDFIFNFDATPQPIVSYPAAVIKACGHNLNIEAAKEIPQQVLMLAATPLTHTSNASTISPIPVFSEMTVKGSPAITKFPPGAEPLFVDDVDGTIKRIKGAEMTPHYTFAPIHISSYPVLSSQLLNFFATGYAEKMRTDSLNNIFMRALTTPAFGAKTALTTFRVELSQMLEYALSLVMYIEPFNIAMLARNECPIDFSQNLLARGCPVKSTVHVYKQALDAIFKYIETEDLTNEIASMWQQLIVQQFSKCELHFARRDHPHAIVTQLTHLANKRVIQNPEAVGFLLFRSGLSPRGFAIAEADGVKHQIGEKLIYVQGNKVEISHGDAEGDGVVALSLMNTNESLFGTFFELATSIKYFVHFLTYVSSNLDPTILREARSKIYTLFIDAFVSKSPFFVTFSSSVLEFLCQTLPLVGSDLVGDVVIRLSILAAYTDLRKNATVSLFLNEQQITWNERYFLPLKAMFPEFLTETDKQEIEGVDSSQWGMPGIVFPKELDQASDVSEFANRVMRLMKPRKTLAGFPFHLILTEWANYAWRFPAFVTKHIKGKMIEVKIIMDYPQPVQISFAGPQAFMKKANYVIESDSEAQMCPVTTPFMSDAKTLFVFCSDDEILNGSVGRFYFVINEPSNNIQDFVLANRDRFVSDMTQMFIKWDRSLDERLLSKFDLDAFMRPHFTLKVPEEALSQIPVAISMRVICLRVLLLSATNWMLYFDLFTGPDAVIRSLCMAMPMELKTLRLNALINDQSNDDMYEFSIDRNAAADVRMGVSDKLEWTLVAQFAKVYSNTSPRNFRRKGSKPWKLTFNGEIGVDAGAIGREFIVECIADLTHPTNGLFVPVPNAHNEFGEHRESFIPVPSPRHLNAPLLYKMVGVLIGVCIRSGILQDFNLAPFIWDYLATGELSIKGIFEVDDNYRIGIEALQDALKSGMDEETFANRFNMRFVVLNALGEEVQLTQLGRLEKVTLANCSEYITLANEFRISEMREPLQMIRAGLWENLDFKPPVFVTGELLEANSCGRKEISYEEMKRVTAFDGVSQQQHDIFLEVIKNFTPEQRSKLLKFTTGRVKLPLGYQPGEIFIKVDTTKDKVDVLPGASSCFNQLHLPLYSNYEIAAKMIATAIEFAGTFDIR